MSQSILIYILRRDLRYADNPIFHNISKLHAQSRQPYSHVLPLYIFPAQQIETSGFLSSDATASPYPEARSDVAGFWRCGKHRAKFLAETVFDLRHSLQEAQSDLVIRVGMIKDVLSHIIEAFQQSSSSSGRIVKVCMTSEEGVEERREERDVQAVTDQYGIEYESYLDEKYFIDDRDVPLDDITDLPDLFTSYRKMVEPLREAPRKSLTTKEDVHLPPLPSYIPPQAEPFNMPQTLEQILECLCKPLDAKPDLTDMSDWPSGTISAHPFNGGETEAHKRVKHLITSGAATTYKDTRNGMLGHDFSTKLSAWLALGCITARQIHEYLLNFETGNTKLGSEAQGYGKGENKGTGWIRFELLWRDYFRLLCRKYRQDMFHVEGMKNDRATKWKYADNDEIRNIVSRFLKGNTGTGMIDASMRELWHTGYTSNRARQNVGSFLARHLVIDWRIGAEWYESHLIDYDVASNWGNWQSVSITDRTFNPIKQSYANGEYIKAWVAELRGVSEIEGLFQAWKIAPQQQAALGLSDIEYVKSPLKRIEYRPSKKDGPKNPKKKGKGPKAKRQQ